MFASSLPSMSNYLLLLVFATIQVVCSNETKSSSDKELWPGVAQHSGSIQNRTIAHRILLPKLNRKNTLVAKKKQRGHRMLPSPVRPLDPIRTASFEKFGTAEVDSISKGEEMMASVITTAIQSIMEKNIVNKTEDNSIISIMEEILNLPHEFSSTVIGAERIASGMLCTVGLEHVKNNTVATQRILQCTDDIIAGVDLRSVVFSSDECDPVTGFCRRVLP